MSHTDLPDILAYLKTKIAGLNDVHGNNLVGDVTTGQMEHPSYPAVEILYRGTESLILNTAENKRTMMFVVRVLVRNVQNQEEAAYLTMAKIVGEVMDKLDKDWQLNNGTGPVPNVLVTLPSVDEPSYQDRDSGQYLTNDIIVPVIKTFDVKI